VTVLTHSPAETEQAGEALANALTAGTVLALQGDLGAGKTAFTRGLARGLGYPGAVTSPTFTIVNEYEGGRLPLFHFDLYRLGSADELWDIGWEDYMDRGGVCAVEWSERVGDLLAGAAMVTLRRVDDETREITIEGVEP
jgi:tRNA threonylcarbamoyladenosine biosynthesis protein TsaE